MPAADLPVQDDLSTMILSLDAPTWKKVKKALGVDTREEAVGIVEADPKARDLVVGLLDTTLLTSDSETQLTKKRTPKTPTAEVMYGSRKRMSI